MSAKPSRDVHAQDNGTEGQPREQTSSICSMQLQRDGGIENAALLALLRLYMVELQLQ